MGVQLGFMGVQPRFVRILTLSTADVRKRLLRPAPKGCGPNQAKPGILKAFTQFRRMTETLVDHALNSRGQLGGNVIWVGLRGCGCGAGTAGQQREAVTVLP